jgi:CO/xanthine dehydrogenase Mo-binding subunit
LRARQAADVAIAQIAAEELEVPFERVNVVMGDTACTVSQGVASDKHRPSR